MAEEIKTSRTDKEEFDANEGLPLGKLLVVEASFSRQLERDLTLVTQERDALRDCFTEIETWAKAYPLNVFPEPDLKRAHEVLKAAGMTLDAVSASSMRHVLNEVMEIAKRALKAEGT